MASLDPAVLDELVTAFERVELTPDTFHHREHLLVGLMLVARHPDGEAITRMRAGLQALLARAGADAAYHETLTQFWMRLLRHRLDATDSSRSLQDRISEVLVWCEAGPRIDAHYSAERLTEPAARHAFLSPDRAPLPDGAVDSRHAAEAR